MDQEGVTKMLRSKYLKGNIGDLVSYIANKDTSAKPSHEIKMVIFSPHTSAGNRGEKKRKKEEVLFCTVRSCPLEGEFWHGDVRSPVTAVPGKSTT